MFELLDKALDVAGAAADLAIDTTVGAVNSTTDLLGSLVEGELPTKKQMRNLIDSGVDIYEISDVTGLATETLLEILSD